MRIRRRLEKTTTRYGCHAGRHATCSSAGDSAAVMLAIEGGGVGAAAVVAVVLVAAGV
jgi:hypothetical protein